MEYQDLKPGEKYRFNTRAPSILGLVVNNAELIAITGWTAATRFDPLLQNRLTQVNNAIDGYFIGGIDGTWLVFKLSHTNDTYFVLSQRWIEEDSLQLSAKVYPTLTIYGSLEDYKMAQEVLTQLGIEYSIS